MDTQATNYKEHHDPHNVECRHNFLADNPCSCKRKLNRKPFRVVKVHDNSAGQGCRKQFVVEVHPGGSLVIREHGRTRKSSVEVTIASVYERALMLRARAIIANKAREKADRRSTKKLALKLARQAAKAAR